MRQSSLKWSLTLGVLAGCQALSGLSGLAPGPDGSGGDGGATSSTSSNGGATSSTGGSAPGGGGNGVAVSSSNGTGGGGMSAVSTGVGAGAPAGALTPASMETFPCVGECGITAIAVDGSFSEYAVVGFFTTAIKIDGTDYDGDGDAINGFLATSAGSGWSVTTFSDKTGSDTLSAVPVGVAYDSNDNLYVVGWHMSEGGIEVSNGRAIDPQGGGASNKRNAFLYRHTSPAIEEISSTGDTTPMGIRIGDYGPNGSMVEQIVVFGSANGLTTAFNAETAGTAIRAFWLRTDLGMTTLAGQGAMADNQSQPAVISDMAFYQGDLILCGQYTDSASGVNVNYDFTSTVTFPSVGQKNGQTRPVMARVGPTTSWGMIGQGNNINDNGGCAALRTIDPGVLRAATAIEGTTSFTGNIGADHQASANVPDGQHSWIVLDVDPASGEALNHRDVGLTGPLPATLPAGTPRIRLVGEFDGHDVIVGSSNGTFMGGMVQATMYDGFFSEDLAAGGEWLTLIGNTHDQFAFGAAEGPGNSMLGEIIVGGALRAPAGQNAEIAIPGITSPTLTSEHEAYVVHLNSRAPSN